ncbi:hypothetical protein DDK22_15955 [Cupriavidus necator]|uniref:Uncharacterized protein n=1 Tax=Cupriavidus necator TaxID=106590 RepID=A0A367PKA0_CUPNE|nr:hypothetical protein DDK22_15955 [Cupriavidus necator]
MRPFLPVRQREFRMTAMQNLQGVPGTAMRENREVPGRVLPAYCGSQPCMAAIRNLQDGRE